MPKTRVTLPKDKIDNIMKDIRGGISNAELRDKYNLTKQQVYYYKKKVENESDVSKGVKETVKRDKKNSKANTKAKTKKDSVDKPASINKDKVLDKLMEKSSGKKYTKNASITRMPRGSKSDKDKEHNPFFKTYEEKKKYLDYLYGEGCWEILGKSQLKAQLRKDLLGKR